MIRKRTTRVLLVLGLLAIAALPARAQITTGTVAGGYVWVAVYSGDDNNGAVSESNPDAEQVTVNPARPTLVTTASPTAVALPAPVRGGSFAVSRR